MLIRVSVTFDIYILFIIKLFHQGDAFKISLSMVFGKGNLGDAASV